MHLPVWRSVSQGLGRKARCEDCGSAACFPYRVAGRQGYVWLCGSCFFLLEHPDASRATPLPRERRAKRLQKETLFDVEQPS